MNRLQASRHVTRHTDGDAIPVVLLVLLFALAIAPVVAGCLGVGG